VPFGKPLSRCRFAPKLQKAVSAVDEWLVESRHVLLLCLYITLLFNSLLMNTILKEKLGNDPVPLEPSPQKRRTNSWRNFKHGKALYQHKA